MSCCDKAALCGIGCIHRHGVNRQIHRRQRPGNYNPCLTIGFASPLATSALAIRTPPAPTQLPFNHPSQPAMSSQPPAGRKYLIEHTRPPCHLLRVRSVKAMLALLLALAWAPLVSHCTLENFSGLAFLRCAPDSQTSANLPAHCGTSCCAAESGNYQLPGHQPELRPPDVAPSILALLAKPLPPLSSTPAVAPRASSQPDRPRTWQFSLRAALPVRAPSIAS